MLGFWIIVVILSKNILKTAYFMKFYRTFLPTFRGSFEGKNGLQTLDAIFFYPNKSMYVSCFTLHLGC